MWQHRRPIPFVSLVKMARKAENAHQLGELSASHIGFLPSGESRQALAMAEPQ